MNKRIPVEPSGYSGRGQAACMPNVIEKYGIDMSDVRRIEGLFGQKLPDIIEPLRLADADVEALRFSAQQHGAVADEALRMHADLTQVRSNVTWGGQAGAAATDALDVVLTVLKYIAAIILFIVGALLALIALLLYSIAALLQLIGKTLAVVAACVAVIVMIVAIIRSGGRGQTGRLTMIWESLRTVFNTTYLASLGITGALGDGLGWVFEQAAKGVMWLGLYLIEVGGNLTGTSDEEMGPLREERKKIFD
ncbi:hypothetical protein ACFP2T_30095 [Plantactinospora solaniradicis]|uniref:Uncharacterized protein n=1 Tax=Plantactinospora solaniradicis TaxID=1723736 RepID=A0ABW1KHH1_9ACTN